MSPGIIGALVGLLIGLIEYVVLFPLIYKAAQARHVDQNEPFSPPRLMELVRLSQLIILPVLGYVMASVLFANVNT